MPKQRVHTRGASKNTIARNVHSKLRIGGRKSGKPAHSMTTEDLLKVLTDSNKTRFKNNAMTVLRKRQVDVEVA